MPQTQWPKHLSQFWRWEVQGECVSKIGFPEASSMACRQLPSLCVLTWPFVCDCASLGREDPLEEEMAIHSSILAWKNLMDNGSWRATGHRITNSRIRLSN